MSKEKEVLEKNLIDGLIRDRRADRRWRNIRFIGWMFILLLYAILIFSPSRDTAVPSFKNQPYVSLVRLNGIIMPGSDFSARKVVPELIKAFRDTRSKGVVLVVNSPGGSPVQASIIHDKIEFLKKQYHKKVVVVGEDALASGAYLVATAADTIYVNRDTLTGSIGVIMSGFGFSDAIQKLGITRRVFTAGENKDRLDPFKPLTPADVEKVKTVLDDVHKDFVNDVVEGRGSRLHGNPEELFSGDFWSGSQAVKLGLVDGTANLWTVLRKEFNVKYYRDYTSHGNLIAQILKGAETQLHLHLMYDGSPLKAEAFN